MRAFVLYGGDIGKCAHNNGPSRKDAYKVKDLQYPGQQSRGQAGAIDAGGVDDRSPELLWFSIQLAISELHFRLMRLFYLFDLLEYFFVARCQIT